MTNALNQYQPISANGGIQRIASQATAIEQSRAVAEVQAAMLVAQQCPRIRDVAIAEMRDSCAQKSVAENAFFRYPRGGETVTGPSIHLARELARCWGNVNFGITELRRDGAASEMLAYAWDLQTNTRNANSFIQPHIRDTKRGAVKLTDIRDVYENNANNGARRLREAIFAVLPAWFVNEAIARCEDTLTKGDSTMSKAQRAANAIGMFSNIGVTRAQLETKVGRPSKEWTPADLAQLGTIFKSIQAGEVTVADEFPKPQRVTADEVRQQQQPPAEPAENIPADIPADASNTSAKPDSEQVEPSAEALMDLPSDAPSTQSQRRDVYSMFKDAEIVSGPARLRATNLLLGRTDNPVKNLTDLTARDAATLHVIVLDHRNDLVAYVEQLAAEADAAQGVPE